MRLKSLKTGIRFRFLAFNSPVFEVVDSKFYMNVETNKPLRLWRMKNQEVIIELEDISGRIV